jgi:NAD(P)-dependent dehydrogenase (short-subunit alcohol dehydrogenase family)
MTPFREETPMTTTPLFPTPLLSTWLIATGAGALPRALAEAALDDGARLVLAGTSPADLAELADLPADRVRMVALDAADPASAAAAVRAAVEWSGRLDVVVTSPAPAPAGGVPDRVAAELAVAVALAEAALPVFRRQRSGAVLHLASAPVGAAARAAGRAAEGWFEALHEEAAPLGVAVTVAQPGAVPGDPARVARVLADVVTGPHAPQRLVLGADALHRGTQSARGRLQELEVWSDVSRSTDRPGAPVRSIDRGLAAVLHLAVPAAS